MLNRSTATDWFLMLRSDVTAKLRLFCIPYAGGSAQVYRRWPNYLPEAIDACAVQLPGRGNRLHEAPFTRLEPLVDAVLQGIAPHTNRPFAVFGHSMGALIAFELVRKLETLYNRSPLRLIVSGCRAPHIPSMESQTYDLPEPEFLEYVRKLNGTPREVLEHPELMSLMLPLLRADFAVCQTYKHLPGPPLICPITALGGLEDKEVTRDHLSAWSQHTSGSFKLRMFAGGHFFLHSAEPSLVRVLAQDLAVW
jgi:surfactin synthase thioesterase subunit